jgi:hypothetical protein
LEYLGAEYFAVELEKKVAAIREEYEKERVKELAAAGAAAAGAAAAGATASVGKDDDDAF